MALVIIQIAKLSKELESTRDQLTALRGHTQELTNALDESKRELRTKVAELHAKVRIVAVDCSNGF